MLIHLLKTRRAYKLILFIFIYQLINFDHWLPSDLYSRESTIQILDRLCYSNREKKYVFQRKVKELKKSRKNATSNKKKKKKKKQTKKLKKKKNKKKKKKKKNETAIEVILEWIDL